eukprot:gene34884-43014_t
MQYFVTGATGFIGKRLVKKLLARKGSVVYFLLREGSRDKLAGLYEYWGATKARAIPVFGDLRSAKLGVSKDDIKKLTKSVDHFYHLAAVYDMLADADEQIAVNVEGTRNAVEFANAIQAGILHHVSSIAAAGMFEGIFREDMFDEAENLDHPYFATKHESEKIVRNETRGAWRVYRPGLVVGDSKTGEMDKIDGPYYFFKLIQRIRQLLPPWMPTIGIEGGRINIVPVDYVVNAMDHISHQPKLDGRAFHLTDPEPMRVGEVLNTFCRAAHAPTMSIRINAALFGFIPKSIKKGVFALSPVRRVRDAVMKDLGLPPDLMTFVNYPTRFDNRDTAQALKGTGIACPPLEKYAAPVWDYWERNLDPDLFIDHTLRGQVAGKVVLVTGGSSGIGLAAAHKLAEAGAITIICGRDEDKLLEAKKEVEARGFELITYQADLSDMADCDRFAQVLIANHGGVDVLVNNAGRSIRRAIEASYDRFHDFERTMQLNYFGALRLTMALLPSMTARKRGHVINISSIGVLTRSTGSSAVHDWVPASFNYRIDLGFEAPAEGEVPIEGNPTMLREALSNLIDNALRYTPAGGAVTVRVRRSEREGVVEVEDTGPGIPPAERTHVFERFYRILGSSAEGSGLGLAIVREIAQQHGADIDIFSNPRSNNAKLPGSLFRLSFPLRAPVDHAAPPPSSPAPTPAPAGIDPGSLRARRALHWRKTRRVSTTLLLLWLATSFGAVFFARELTGLMLFGWPLSFYLAAQGASLVYLAIIGIYAWRMQRLDRQFHAAALPAAPPPGGERLSRYYLTFSAGFACFLVALAVLENEGMPRVWIGYLFMLATITLYAAIGLVSRTSNVAEYYVAGRRVPAMFNGMATAADWISAAREMKLAAEIQSAASFISLAGTLYLHGFDGL